MPTSQVRWCGNALKAEVVVQNASPFELEVRLLLLEGDNEARIRMVQFKANEKKRLVLKGQRGHLVSTAWARAEVWWGDRVVMTQSAQLL